MFNVKGETNMARAKKQSTKKTSTKKPKIEEPKPDETPTEEVIEEVPEEKPAEIKEAPKVEEVKTPEAPKVEPAETKEAPKEEVTEPKAPAPKPEAKAPPAPKKKAVAPAEEESKMEEIEFEDIFDKERAYAHVKELAIPRLVGSEGEQKAADYITKKFKGLNLETTQEEFGFTDFAWGVLIRLMEGLKAGLLVIALVLLLLPSPAIVVGVVISVATLFITFYSSIWARIFWKYQNSEGKLFKVTKYKSKNIVAKLPAKTGAKDASGNIVLLADYDSKSQIFSALYRVIFFYLGLFISIIFPIAYIGNYVLTTLSIIVYPGLFLPLVIMVGVSVVATVLLELNTTGNKSSGAINNATGLGTMLELAQIHATVPLENFNLTFLAAGAGEMGLFGAISFLKAHESEFPPEDTYFINLKDIAARGHFYIPGPIGFPPKPPCLEVENLYKKALKRRKLPLKEGSKVPIRVLSPWVFTGAWNDDMIAVLRGFYANRVGIGGHIRKRHIIHTAKDTIEQVDIDAIDIVGKVTAEVLKRLDLRARP